MKKNILIVFSLFIAGIFNAMAQPSTTNIPNPYTDASIIPTGALKISLYGASGTTAGASLYTNATNYVTGTAFALPAETWKTGYLKFTAEPFATYPAATYKYLYFVYSGNVNNYVVYMKNTAKRAGVSYNIPGSDWKLYVFDISDWATGTGTIQLGFQTGSTTDAGYIANVCLASKPYQDPNVPSGKATDPPERPAGTYLSLYNDRPYASSPATLVKYNSGVVSEYSFPNGEKAAKIVTSGGGGYAGGNFLLSAATDVSSYTTFYFDIYPLEDATAGELKARLELYDSPYYYLNFNLPALTKNTWTTVEFKIANHTGSWDPKGHVIPNFKALRFLTDSAKTFYVDNVHFFKDLTPQYSVAPQYDNRINIFADGGGTAMSGTWNEEVTDGIVNGGDAYKRIPNLADGANFTLGSQSSLSTHNMLHMDVWVENAQNTEITIALENNNGESDYVTISSSQLHGNTWNRINIMLSDFDVKLSGSIEDGRFKKLTFSGTNYAVYLDNVYFYTTTLPTTTAAPVPDETNPNNVLRVYTEHLQDADEASGTGLGTRFSTEKSFTTDTNDNYRVMPGTSQYVHIDLGEDGIPTAEWAALHVHARASASNTYLDVKIEGIELDGTSAATSISELIPTGEWARVTASLEGEVGRKGFIKSVKLAASDNVVFLDNIYFYKSVSDLQAPGTVTVAGSNGANGNYPSLYRALTAIQAADQSGKTIVVTVNGNSVEDREIQVTGGSYTNWASLTIQPASTALDGGGGYTVSFEPAAMQDQTYLLYFSKIKNVTINGLVGGERALTFKGIFNLSMSSWLSDSNSIIHIASTDNENITIKNCIFTNNPGSRSISAISGTGVSRLTIENNEFRNCLSTQAVPNEEIAAVLDFRTALNNINILGNYFYETEVVKFESFHSRAFIYVKANSEGFTGKINNNKIGGTGLNFAGGGNLTFDTSGTSTHLYGIRFQIDNEIASNAANIEITGNTIANFNCANTTTAYYNGNAAVASFTGIEAGNSTMNISGNTVENVQWTAQSNGASSSSTPLAGIFCRVYKATKSAIYCNNNKMSGMKLSMLGGTSLKIYSNAIRIQNEVYTELLEQVECSGNRILWSINDPSYAYGDGSELGVVLVMDNRGWLPLNLYNNIVTLSACNLSKSLSTVGLYRIQLAYALATGSAGQTANIYNNIAYTQGSASDFAGNTTAKGMSIFYSTRGSQDNIYFYHNTVLANNAGQPVHGVNYQHIGSNLNSKLHSWNNNIVNNTAAGGYILNLGGTTEINKDPLIVDYNNYYSPRTSNYFAHGYNAGAYYARTFDDWKFRNTLWMMSPTGERDFHSSFVNPKFGGVETSSININLDYDGLESLKTLLKPTVFIAGRDLSGESQPSTGADIAGAGRRTLFPTPGAVETDAAAVNMWKGATSTDWNIASNWTKGVVPDNNKDVIFAPDVVRDLVLDQNRMVHDIYNDSEKDLKVNGKNLTISGLVRMDGTGRIDARKSENESSTITYNPVDRPVGGLVQHLYAGTYKEDEISNLNLNNNVNYYFVLLYDKLNITRNFSVSNTTSNAGVLHCTFYPTELKFSGAEDQEIPYRAIYNDSVYNLVIDGKRVVANHTNLYVKNNLTIEAEKNLEISTDNLVQVFGTTNNKAGIPGLLIKSDPALLSRMTAESAKASGSFIFSQKDAVQATVEYHSRATTQAGTATKTDLFDWQYFGPAVETYPAAEFHGAYIRKFDQSQSKGFWKSLTNDDSLEPFTGYEISRYADKNGSFNLKGRLVNRDYSFQLNKTDGATYSGQYVFSNPYTASLPINEAMFAEGANIENVIYLFNTGTLKEWTGGVGTARGHYISIPVNLAGTMGYTSIPSMQGFVVRTSSGTENNTFKFVYGNNNVVKNNKPMRSKEESVPVFTKVNLYSGEELKDQMWLFTDENSTYGFDNGYDGYKLIFSAHKALLCALGSDNVYQVNTVPDVNGTELYFMAESGIREYTLTFDHTNIDQNYGSLYLQDLKTNQEVEITATNSTYTFTADNETVPEIRFRIKSERQNNDVTTSNEIYTYQFNSNLFVRNGYENGGEVYLYDLSGQLLQKCDVSGLSTVLLSEKSLSSGIYILKVKVKGESDFSTKLVIR